MQEKDTKPKHDFLSNITERMGVGLCGAYAL